jgi:hypothetical protein
MAELAGRVGDGINLQAGHPQLERLLSIARDAFAARGGDPDTFLVTVLSALDDRWARPGDPARRRLDAAGVDRLVLLVRPRAVADIRRVGRSLMADGR